jgi:hypothetical protein
MNPFGVASLYAAPPPSVDNPWSPALPTPQPTPESLGQFVDALKPALGPDVIKRAIEALKFEQEVLGDIGEDEDNLLAEAIAALEALL